MLGAPVSEGELLTTGADGYIYVKTLDDGLFILRPNTRARIATYRVDAKNPANTRIKLELMKGVARSQSGNAVKLARQNFRFNTPVAAIGVRGTDFTVFTDNDVSSVAVISGGITISGFSGGCRPEGTGPCEGATSRELTAAQRGQLLQIQRGQPSARLLPGGVLSPDTVAPPRGDEPIGKNNVGTPNVGLSVPEPLLDPIKSANVQNPGESKPNTPPVQPPPVIVSPPEEPPVVVVPPVVTPPPVVVTPPVVVVPDPTPVVHRTIVWGRFQPILDQAAQVVLAEQNAAKAQRIALLGSYALYRTTVGAEYLVPERGSVGFVMKDGEAYIASDNVTVLPVKARMENGLLNFDFDKKKFSTSFDLISGAETFKLAAGGTVASDGRFGVISQYAPGNNMTADGVLSNADGGSAAYVFRAPLSAGRTANGITYWGCQTGCR
ncbi:FecR domain-containing protein [Herminiimonas sp.]|uniref:FecR family protein n=1 Tax=Herminiimonas sp. TaxID=1926289 RepID=UPI00271F9D3D|nr:FecR domain-containing protein [Herminiimonas sp.]MDO8305157.1 FecR domain-containing protein [Herminiimonas sp.]